MSEAATETTTTSQDGSTTSTDSGTTSTAPEFKAITSQEDLDKVLGERLTRERAKFADYKAVKAKAAKLDEIEQANLTELEKANGRVTTAETERDTAKAEAMRLRIAVQHGISLEDADLFLTGTTEETLTAQAQRLSDRAAAEQQAEADRKKKGPIVPKEGTSTKTGTTTDEDDLEFAGQFFRGSGGQ